MLKSWIKKQQKLLYFHAPCFPFHHASFHYYWYDVQRTAPLRTVSTVYCIQALGSAYYWHGMHFILLCNFLHFSIKFSNRYICMYIYICRRNVRTSALAPFLALLCSWLSNNKDSILNSPFLLLFFVSHFSLTNKHRGRQQEGETEREWVNFQHSNPFL